MALLVYLPTLRFGFVWDDHFIVEANRQIRTLTNLPALLGSHAFSGAGDLLAGERLVEYYRPAWTVSLAVDHAVWGLNPFGYHLTNVLLHAAVSVAVFVLAQAWWPGLMAPVLAGLVFALHPVHVEAVAWVSARNELLAGLFVVIALAAYAALRAGESSGAPGPSRVRMAALMLVAAALALLSKETAVALPLMAATVELLPGRGSAWARLRWPLALAVLTLGYLLVRAAMVHGHADPHPLAWRMLTAPRILAEYLKLAVAPDRLKVFYDLAIVKSASAALALETAVLALWVGVAVSLRGRAPAVFTGMTWTLLALLPVSGVIVLLQPALLAERYLYLPTLGVALALAGGFALAWDRWPRARTAMGAIAGVLLLLCGVLCVRQSRAWAGDDTLMARMVKDAPNEVTGYANLGVVLEREGRIAEARTAYERAVALAPADHLHHRNLAVALGKLGRDAEAEREFRAALTLDGKDADAFYGLGWLYARKQMWPNAEAVFKEAIRARPGVATFHSALANVLLNMGRNDEALSENREAVRLDPALPEAHYGLALSLGQAERFADAAEEFKRALALKPEWAEAHFDLGATLARLDRTAEARAEFETVIRLTSGNPELRGLANRALYDLGSKP